MQAEETLAGSINALQSAFGNLLVGFGRAEADIQVLTGSVVDAF